MDGKYWHEYTLKKEEKNLWEGKPGVAIIIESYHLSLIAAGFFVWFILLAYLLVAPGDDASAWLFVPLIFVMGSGAILYGIFLKAAVFATTQYLLTDQRAIIYVGLPLHPLKGTHTFLLSEVENLRIEHGPPDSVFFGTFKYEYTGYRGGRRTTIYQMGFERIPDGNKIHDLIQKQRQKNA